MSNIWFCSDLHFGHKRIGEFRQPWGITSEEENRERIKRDWNDVVTKRDDVYVLGDACFTMDTLDDFRELKGRKFLIRGNHDTLNTAAYLKVFDEVYGLWKYKGMWLSHAPIHSDELRNKPNLHGHVHNSTIADVRYLNCCPENLWPKYKRCLVSLDEVRKLLESAMQT